MQNRITFSNVIGVLLENTKKTYAQYQMIEDIFYDCLCNMDLFEKDDFEKNVTYSRWCTGDRPISKEILSFYDNAGFDGIRDNIQNDVIPKTYFSRWRIEEYFRCKKQMFHFENFRVRKLTAINALNFYITVCMAFLAHISMKSESNALKVAIIQEAEPIKEKVHFCYYRLTKGISDILSYAKEGVRLWFLTNRPAYRQLCLKLTA